MTLLKDLIDIPEHIQKGDFVLKLAEDIKHPEMVLESYVVTRELAKCFDAALAFIRSAVQGRTSKAAYLHGSFGSGKSHFMAVLHLILQGNPNARGIPELAPVIQKHNDWLAGKKFLLVPYHMIGAHDMESGILGGYVEFIRQAKPEAPIPPVYVSASIISQAMAERASYGDEPFFNRLNAGGERASGNWGDLEVPWDAASFEEAAAAPPDAEAHLRLVSTLLKTVATSHAEIISQRGGNFVRFDIGLSLISQHAKRLGYDALILFLDELILWLATNSADLGFVKREAAKLTKLVEAQSAERPIPIVSFVARQRDLRELVGTHVPGAEKLSFSDSLDYQEGRFDTITLEDRNLPAIAEKRVLKCKGQAARDQLDAAFELTAKIRDSVMNILLTSEGDRKMFRQVYPFSPALAQTLIAVSSVLQRERTALKVMMQLLVDHRDHLKVGDVVPVGDLFDVVAHGDEAFSPEMAIHFDNAKKLFHQKLLPMLEKQHGIRREEVEQLPYDDSKRVAFRNDDRLVKTLLLSALVPEVESLRGLNAEKLAALNHGTIKVPIAGSEGREVLRRLKNWAAGVGEIRIGEGDNPTISVQLSGVDTESIIEQARREDNQGNQIRRVRQMLFEQLGIQGEGQFEQFHEFFWRNTKRSCKVIFSNVRELPDSSLENADDYWKLVIDFPFDEAGHGPKDDLSRVDRFKQSHPGGAKTLCWVPSFFSPDARKDLGLLVILEHILTGERFGQYSNQLSPQDRPAARSLLENQWSVLKQRVQNHLDAAYGVDESNPGSVDNTFSLELNEHFVSLTDGFAPQPPVAPHLAGAMQHLVSQALEYEFPGAPDFGTEAKSATFRKVYELIAPAAQMPEGRIPVDKAQRLFLRQIANPLLLGDMGPDATHFLLGQHWKTHFMRKAAGTGSPMTVGQLREWIDLPRAMGLPKEAQYLVIVLFAAQANLCFYLHGGPFEATLTNVPDACELRTVDLPQAPAWETAIQRASSIFGMASSPLLSAGNVSALAADVKKKAGEVRKALQAYGRQLDLRMKQLSLKPEETDRRKTATATQLLVEQLSTAEPAEIVDRLASAQVASSETAMGECVGKATELGGNLNTAGWDLFDLISKLTDQHQATAREILAEIREALTSDEHAVALAPALKGAQAKAVSLLQKAVQVPPQTPKPPVTPPPINPPLVEPPVKLPGRRVAGEGTKQNLTLPEAGKLLTDLKEKIKPGQAARISVSWVIEEGGTVS
ncbi:MAG: phage resistance protein [Planctomycetaceae bacterium]|nr:phage resistance protein [Planctomycetaceae bacterium]